VQQGLQRHRFAQAGTHDIWHGLSTAQVRVAERLWAREHCEMYATSLSRRHGVPWTVTPANREAMSLLRRSLAAGLCRAGRQRLPVIVCKYQLSARSAGMARLLPAPRKLRSLSACSRRQPPGAPLCRHNVSSSLRMTSKICMIAEAAHRSSSSAEHTLIDMQASTTSRSQHRNDQGAHAFIA
jgi:hypothetical protein